MVIRDQTCAAAGDTTLRAPDGQSSAGSLHNASLSSEEPTGTHTNWLLLHSRDADVPPSWTATH